MSLDKDLTKSELIELLVMQEAKDLYSAIELLLFYHKIDKQDFCKKVKFTRSYLHLLLKGKCSPVGWTDRINSNFELTLDFKQWLERLELEALQAFVLRKKERNKNAVKRVSKGTDSAS